MLLGVFFLPIQLCAPGNPVLLFFRGSEKETQSDTAYQFFKQHPQTGVSGLGVYQLYDLARSVSVPIEQIGRPHTGVSEAAAGVLRGRRLRRDHDTTGGVLGQVRVPEAAAGIVD